MSFIKIAGIVIFNGLIIYVIYNRVEHIYESYKNDKKIYALDVLLVIGILCISFLLYSFYLYDLLLNQLGGINI